MSGLEDLKTTPSVETDKSISVDKPETENILGDSAPDTVKSGNQTQDPSTTVQPQSTSNAQPASTSNAQSPGGVVMPTGTAVNPQAAEVKSLNKDTSDKDVSMKLTELIKVLEFDYPILRQLQS